MTQPKYTTLNQFANMLERRVVELTALSRRLQNETGFTVAADLTDAAAGKLSKAAGALRLRHRRGEKPEPQVGAGG